MANPSPEHPKKGFIGQLIRLIAHSVITKRFTRYGDGYDDWILTLLRLP